MGLFDNNSSAWQKELEQCRRALQHAQFREQRAHHYATRSALGARQANRAVKKYKTKLARVKAAAAEQRKLLEEARELILRWVPPMSASNELVDRISHIVDWQQRRRAEATTQQVTADDQPAHAD